MKREGIEKLLTAPSSLGNIAFAADGTERILDTDVSVGRVVRIIQGLEISAADAVRLRARLDAGAESEDVTLVAKPGGGATTVVLLDHLPPEQRERYAQFIQAG